MDSFNNELYNSKREKVEFNDYIYFGQGMCARVYKKDDKVLKVYKDGCPYIYHLSKSVFEKIKKLDLNNIVKLDDYYHFFNFYLEYKLPMDAYTMEYIEKDNVNLLECDKDYILDTINELEKTIILLSKNKIEVNDLHHTNMIFNSKGATLIDLDTYHINKIESYRKLLLENKRKLLECLKECIKNSIDIFEMYKIYYLLNFNLKNSTIVDGFKNIFTEDTLYNSIKKYL